jgi:poly(3-hydroxybutyrate) depolymerase
MGRDGADVLFYQVNGGGHQTPTRMSVDINPHPLIGRTNRDIETAEVTWDFFKRFRLP